MLTVRQLLEIDTAAVGGSGMAASALRQQNVTMGSRVEAFLREVQRRAREDPRTTPRRRPVHPAAVARREQGASVPGSLDWVTPEERTRGEGSLNALGLSPAQRDAARESGRRDLTSGELAWLQRIPEDPRAVPFEDAVRLARMADSVANLELNSAMLVRSIWTPIDLHHDEIVTRDQISALTPVAVSSAARGAVSELVADEHPGLPDDAHAAIATAAIDQFLERADSRYELQLDRLNRHLAAVLRRKAERFATTYTGAPATS